ncbi:MAG: Gfo/Idh/MocA family oxidoreductase [Candidatus Hydrogenedentes bacterium]|nr:Gfo/Idh/MocA family oxidoreductase [Candidatus Hydrogenedentota bacterium]
MSSVTRRNFLKTAGAGVLASSALVQATSSVRAAPSRQVRHAVIGLGSQGRRHAKGFEQIPNCELLAICDVDPEQRAKTLSALKNPENVKEYEDFRHILDRKDIDTISVATPDHWHAPIALAAMIAGKHVYVEKPCCHNIREGQLLVEAAEKYKKCCQHGTQSRSGQGIKDAIQFMRDGKLGKVRAAKAINHQLREPVGRAPEENPPTGVNYDLWLGPAPVHAFTRNRWHYEWHWFWDYGTGDTGNDGIHQMDIARWGLGVQFPKAVSAPGGQLFYEDDHETPDTQIATFEFDGCYLIYEMRLWTDYPLEGHDNGNVFYGDKGVLEIGRRGCEVTLIGEPKKQLGGGSDWDANARNFIECVLANNPAGLNAPITEGFASATLCHLANISTRVGRKLQYDAAKHECIGDADANKLLAREYRQGYELPKLV